MENQILADKKGVTLGTIRPKIKNRRKLKL